VGLAFLKKYFNFLVEMLYLMEIYCVMFGVRMRRQEERLGENQCSSGALLSNTLWCLSCVQDIYVFLNKVEGPLLGFWLAAHSPKEFMEKLAQELA
jgi:hypothetical protein